MIRSFQRDDQALESSNMKLPLLVVITSVQEELTCDQANLEQALIVITVVAAVSKFSEKMDPII